MKGPEPTMTDAAAATEAPPRRGVPRLVLFLGLIAAIVVALLVLPVDQWLKDFLAWVEGAGIWGPILLAAQITRRYALAAVCTIVFFTYHRPGDVA